MKRKLKAQLAKGKRSTAKRKTESQRFTSYDTSNPETDTYQEAREQGESSRQLLRRKKSKT